ncbi:PREDICTED: uncharacterized protein LOC109174808 isoform X1 [Ipomoea nil]|uniref:uncharacterized protein LOC109174808 isoform X1 n=1 Tax=Ipomoea nil TaxID=35883 RepID=UPI000901F3AD|nr:PREDICTED: uncharacterized protein LOC109174808 isoform X1 [Ipomoea nil]
MLCYIYMLLPTLISAYMYCLMPKIYHLSNSTVQSPHKLLSCMLFTFPKLYFAIYNILTWLTTINSSAITRRLKIGFHTELTRRLTRSHLMASTGSDLSSASSFLVHNILEARGKQKHKMADNNVELLLFWGGEITKNGDMGSVDFSKPPKAMCFLSRSSSSYDGLVRIVHAVMNTYANNTRLVLFGRCPMISPGGQTVLVPVPLIDDQSWKWFLQVTSRSQSIHVYAIAERRTDDGQSCGQEAPLLRGKTYPWDSNGERVVTFVGFCSQMFNKAVMEPEFSEMFADIFYRLSSMLPEFYVNNETYSFKRLLLNQCQEEFEKGKADREFASDQEKVIHMRRRKWGNIKLIGELYKKKMLTERIIHECIKKLLGGQYEYENPDEEDVETLCHLMQTVGETIDHPKAKEHMDLYFETISKLINHPTLSSRLKEMLVHLVDLRENKWQKMGKVEGSKMFEDFHPTS